MAQQQVTVFEYAIILQPKYDKDGERVEEGAVLDNGMVLATDQAQATILIGRKIPEERLDQLERVTLAVRPF